MKKSTINYITMFIILTVAGLLYDRYKLKTKMDEEVILKKTVNEVLDKLNVEGWENLSDSEQQILYRASEIYSNRDQPN